jgi:hypothetical protein
MLSSIAGLSPRVGFLFFISRSGMDILWRKNRKFALERGLLRVVLMTVFPAF